MIIEVDARVEIAIDGQEIPYYEPTAAGSEGKCVDSEILQAINHFARRTRAGVTSLNSLAIYSSAEYLDYLRYEARRQGKTIEEVHNNEQDAERKIRRLGLTDDDFLRAAENSPTPPAKYFERDEDTSL